MKDEYNGYSFPFEQMAQELYRITAKGGMIVWVVGDAVIKGSETGSSFRQALYFMELGFKLHDTMIYEKNGSSFPARRDGNRYSQLFEYMFVFSKGKPKTSNLICDKPNRWAGYTHFGKGSIRNKKGELVERNIKPIPEFSPRNNIWKYNTGKNYSTKDKIAFQHPAIFPEKLAGDHILTWTNEGDVVFDPMAGSGTTPKMALINNRNYVGIEISEDYCEIARTRISDTKDLMEEEILAQTAKTG
jgi:site-specific DNA-methyltransferase (adenine-specific)